MSTLPFFYYPSTTFFIDDDKAFLMHFTLPFADELRYQLFHSPLQALQVIAETEETIAIEKHCLSEHFSLQDKPETTLSFQMDLSPIHWQLYNPHRFDDLSVIVVDYAMPEMTGVEFCQQVQSHAKRILLTGSENPNIAIDAFNNGCIDAFVRKQDPIAYEKVQYHIHRLRQRYFQERSACLFSLLNLAGAAFLNDPTFSTWFTELCTEHHIVEYYLLDKSGSFVLVDAHGKTSHLIMKSEADLIAFVELASEFRLAESDLQSVRKGKKIPIWDASKTFNAACLMPAKALSFSGQPYFYVFLSDSCLGSLQTDKIVPYAG